MLRTTACLLYCQIPIFTFAAPAENVAGVWEAAEPGKGPTSPVTRCDRLAQSNGLATRLLTKYRDAQYCIHDA